MVKKKKSWKNTLLNVLAVCLTITPIFSVGAWAFTALKGDGRVMVELASVSKSDNPRLFKEPLISVTFDDGWESIYINAMPIASKYDIATTQYILPGMFTSPAYVSLNQTKHMKEIGHEIASHTYTHANLTEANQKTRTKELKAAYDLLVENKLAEPNMNFAPPNGAFNKETTDEAKRYYGSQRNVSANFANGVGDKDVNIEKSFDRYNIIGYTVGPYTTMEQLAQAIDYAKKHNGWLVLIYHQIEAASEPHDGTPSYNVNPEDFEEHLRLIQQSNVKTAKVIEVLDGLEGDK